MRKRYLGNTVVKSKISLSLKVPLFFASIVFSAVVNSNSIKTEPDKYLGFLKAENFGTLNVELARLITQYQSDFHSELQKRGRIYFSYSNFLTNRKQWLIEK
jgi:hypothetical protein